MSGSSAKTVYPRPVLEVCQALREYFFPMRVVDERGKEREIDPVAGGSVYMEECQKRVHAHALAGNTLWNPRRLKMVAELARAAEVEVLAVGPLYRSDEFEPWPLGENEMASSEGSVVIGFAAPIQSVSEEDFLRVLKHEIGHVSVDVEKMSAFDPRFKELNLKRRTTAEEDRQAARTYIGWFKSQMPPAKQKNFEKAARDTFGDLSKLSQKELRKLDALLAEALRLGEECHGENYQRFSIDLPDFTYFQKSRAHIAGFRIFEIVRPDGVRVDGLRSLVKATLLESGLWDVYRTRLSARNDYDAAAAEGLPESAVTFFRMAIRASAGSFYPGVVAP